MATPSTPRPRCWTWSSRRASPTAGWSRWNRSAPTSAARWSASSAARCSCRGDPAPDGGRPDPHQRGRPHRRCCPQRARGGGRGGRPDRGGGQRSRGRRAGRAGDATVDVEGGMVLPGFQDAHCHLAMGGYERTLCDLSESRGAEAHLRRIREYAGANPDRGWILGGGWSMSDFPGGVPTRQQLDAVVCDRPVILPNSDYHGAWVNTRALELAGIGRDTPDPFGGRIERDQHGEPVGMLQESAMGLVLDLAPKPDADQRAAGLRTAQEYYHRLGITACQDAAVEPDYQETYERLARAGELTLRVRGNLSWNPALGDEQLDQLIERRLSGTIGRLTCGNVKFFHDGVVENRTAAMLDPYLDAAGAATGEYGIDQYRLADLARHVAACDAAGFGIHIHAIGDR